MPWETEELKDWYIVCMNHYVREGHKRLFCAMSRDNMIIEARGDDAYSVFMSLSNKAKKYNEYRRKMTGK